MINFADLVSYKKYPNNNLISNYYFFYLFNIFSLKFVLKIKQGLAEHFLKIIFYFSIISFSYFKYLKILFFKFWIWGLFNLTPPEIDIFFSYLVIADSVSLHITISEVTQVLFFLLMANFVKLSFNSPNLSWYFNNLFCWF